MVASNAGAQSMKPPKLITWGTDCNTAEAAANHQPPQRMLMSGPSDSATRHAAIAKGSGPDHAEIAGSEWQTVGPLVELWHASAPPGTNCKAKATTDRTGAMVEIRNTTRR